MRATRGVRARVLVACAFVLALAASFLVVVASAVPAQALGDNCSGEQVKRCIRVLKSGDSYYAHAGIEDENGAYDVAVNQIQLQRHDGTEWVTVKSLGDFDGWAATRDEGDTGLHGCSSGVHSFRALAFFQWSGPDSGEQWLTTDNVAPCGESCKNSFGNPRTCAGAVDWAQSRVRASGWGGLCDRFVANAYGWDHSGSASAIIHWNAIASGNKYAGDRSVPPGGLAFFRGGEYGHVMISVGGGTFVSNDIDGYARISTATIAEVESEWGYTYLGWAQPWFQVNH
jgi:hypothetical protein